MRAGRRVIRRRRAIALLVLVGLGGTAVAGAVRSSGARGVAAPAVRAVPLPRGHAAAAVRHAVRAPRPLRLVERAAGTLASAVQDAAATTAPGGAGIVLLGGLGATDRSLDGVLAIRDGARRDLGRLPGALHDAPAVRIGGTAYVFGGGNGVAQLAQITSVDLATGRTARAGSLPAPSSDSAAAAEAGVAYVVGGYTGTRWLDTIVAWRPGRRAIVVAHLPTPLRYTAVTFAHGLLVIAGGSLPDGSASRSILTFDPRARRVRVAGRLPAPTTHAAAATIGRFAYVIGGRGALPGTPSARIVAIDPRGRTVYDGGALATPLSDLAAVSQGATILVAGGRARAGTVTVIGTLRARPTRTVAARAPSAVTAVYAHDGAGMLEGAARLARPLIYVPNSGSDTVDVIDPATYRVIWHFAVGALPQHVTPSWDLRTLYVDNDQGNSLTPIDPRTGRPRGPAIPVADPYNLYFTPDGRSAIVVAERLRRLDFRDPHTFALQLSLPVPCTGIDHMDFSADGRTALASCEFSAELIRIDLRARRVTDVVHLPTGAMPQDVKLSPDGRVYYVADMMSAGVWEISARTDRILGHVHTGAGAHGLYPSRNGRLLYVSNRNAGTISVLDFRTHRVARTWTIPHGTPDMGGVSADGKVLWLSGRYSREIYAIDTRTGRLLARIAVGAGPHGLSVWPQPGRHSLGHTGILR